jgi:hypothetical protein
MMLVPPYWERPELLVDYVELMNDPRIQASTITMGRPGQAMVDHDDHPKCRRCGRRIVAAGSGWRHFGANGGLFAGCRAASFTEDKGWDDTLPRSWKAAPRAP